SIPGPGPNFWRMMRSEGQVMPPGRDVARSETALARSDARIAAAGAAIEGPASEAVRPVGVRRFIAALGNPGRQRLNTPEEDGNRIRPTLPPARFPKRMP